MLLMGSQAPSPLPDSACGVSPPSGQHPQHLAAALVPWLCLALLPGMLCHGAR